MISMDMLFVECKYDILHIESLRIIAKKGEHAVMLLGAVTKPETGDGRVSSAVRNDAIRVYAKDEGEVTIFAGRISFILLNVQSGVYQLSIRAVAATHDMDLERKRRSFQDVNMTYGKLFDEIGKDYPKSQLLLSIDEQAKLPAPILQFDETDWQFIFRIASLQNAALYSFASAAEPRLCAGFPSGKGKHKLAPFSYKARKDVHSIRQAQAQGAQVDQMDFFSYEVQTHELYELGDEVSIFNQTLYVSRKEISLERGTLTCLYDLSPKGSAFALRVNRPRSNGLMLEGRVLETAGETVKLHLDIDESQSKDAAFPFAFAPPTGSLMYCMPAPKTSALVLFPDYLGHGAPLCVGCVRKNGDSCKKTSDPNIRYLETEHGSELMLSPESVCVCGTPDAGNSLLAGDEEGVVCRSGKEIHVHVEGDFSVVAKGGVTVYTSKEIISKSKDGAYWNLSGEANVGGSKVEFNGMSKLPVGIPDVELEIFKQQLALKV